ncbi:MAG: ribosome recycling factor [Sphaerochaeta sp.]|uniref:ribosome recycling factor n=1 Tax=Sphaerochaeta sp. TaxID=1972642 RepID=UPI001D745E7C|nr:ribosome recycling factor [uncultured Sphaerochaeta sp.]MDD3058955.1 ribosome recycling factor [Sphaerochaeta sp.]MDD3929067.1 ribosome recycling factor [Sphaerochaeta sp.]NCC13179.1 ribosome recycling factor [Spirochaetia bacterium]NCC88823.1 ribosome recycling factor [Spirochaetia bacterium]
MQQVLDTCESKMQKSLESLSKDFASLRTGRASASLLDKIRVDYYGAETPINQVATVSVPEARMIVIQPWDKSVLSAIEKAILKSDLGLPPNNDGKLIRLNFPPLNEERRKQLVKGAKANAEQSRVAMRNIRREAMDELKKMQKNGDISEDELKDAETRIQKMTDSYITQVNSLSDEKEKEIMEI